MSSDKLAVSLLVLGMAVSCLIPVVREHRWWRAALLFAACALFAFAGVLSLFVGTTTTAPERWLGWGSFALAAVVLAWLIRDWPLARRRLEPRVRNGEIVVGEPRAFQPGPRHPFWGVFDGSQLKFHSMGGSLLLVEVTNRHPKRRPLHGVLARIEYQTLEGVTHVVDGLWSATPGDGYLPRDSPRQASIGYGDRRMLALAVFLAGPATWVKFGHGDYPPHYGNPQSGGVWSRAGERVDLGSQCRLTLTITATGSEASERYQLSVAHALPTEKPEIFHWKPEVEHLTG